MPATPRMPSSPSSARPTDVTPAKIRPYSTALSAASAASDAVQRERERRRPREDGMRASRRRARALGAMADMRVPTSRWGSAAAGRGIRPRAQPGAVAARAGPKVLTGRSARREDWLLARRSRSLPVPGDEHSAALRRSLGPTRPASCGNGGSSTSGPPGPRSPRGPRCRTSAPHRSRGSSHARAAGDTPPLDGGLPRRHGGTGRGRRGDRGRSAAATARPRRRVRPWRALRGGDLGHLRLERRAAGRRRCRLGCRDPVPGRPGAARHRAVGQTRLAAVRGCSPPVCSCTCSTST
jgi:hypothetical protein